ncbi:hypothetical protein [Gordonia sputi]
MTSSVGVCTKREPAMCSAGDARKTGSPILIRSDNAQSTSVAAAHLDVPVIADPGGAVAWPPYREETRYATQNLAFPRVTGTTDNLGHVPVQRPTLTATLVS